MPPHGLRAQLQKAKLEPIDSDIDLHDGPQAGGRAASGSPPYDSAGAITPSLLAKYHLPDILLNNGPLAIRHITGYLTTSVPGFSSIPPAKARRLVVGALEGRGSGGECGGPDGDVEFEKVGWGRWDARRRGQPPRDAHLSPQSAERAGGIPIARNPAWSAKRGRLGASASSAGESAAFSHDDRDINMMMETEADKMSMDGSASASCSEAPDDDDVQMDDSDVTDDEDWAAVGAAALRNASYSSAKAAHDPMQASGRGPLGGFRSVSYSAGMARAPQPPMGNFGFTAYGGTSDAQEREAVEALLRLGSV